MRVITVEIWDYGYSHPKVRFVRMELSPTCRETRSERIYWPGTKSWERLVRTLNSIHKTIEINGHAISFCV